MKIKLFIILIAIILLSFNINAGGLDFSYTYVNSDSNPTYMNIQYANYYDNIDLKIGLDVIDSSIDSIPVIISPVVYGITSLGNLEFLYAVPNETIYLYQSVPYEYTFNNIFYTTPNYVGYTVAVNAQSLNNLYYETNYAYVYMSDNFTPPEPWNPEDPDPEEPEDQNTVVCSDFYLSGQTDIYLDEDEEETYNLYILNTIDQPLNITSITTNDPSKVDIEDITYPYTINPNSTRTAQLDLVSDTVSSDYSSSFDITLNANYEELTCSKTYTVNYHISDEELESQADCSDISFRNTEFNIDSSSSLTAEVSIVNESLDYDYDIDDIEIEDNDNVSTRVKSYPRNIDKDSEGIIKLVFDTEDIDSTTTENLELKVNGYMTRNGREDKHCRKRENIKLKINKQTNTNTTNVDCSDIKIFTSNITQQEDKTKDYSEANGFFIVNNSNKKFNITSILISDNSTNSDLVKNNIVSTIYPSSKIPLSFNLKTLDVDTTEQSTGSISLKGLFYSGTECTFSDIKKEFKINILDSEQEGCAGVGVISSKVENGVNFIDVYNNTSKDFIINNTLIQNKYNLNVDALENVKTIEANKTTKIKINVSGNGSAEMLLKGKFNSGESCNYTETTSGILFNTYNPINENQENINFSETDNCLFNIDVPTYLEIKDARHKIDLSFINQSHKGGKIILSANGAVVNPSVIYLNGFDEFTKEVLISNFDNPSSIFYRVKLNGCNEQLFFTNLSELVSPTKKIILTSYPLVITPSKNIIFMPLVLENSYNQEKEITIKISGFPDNWDTNSKRVLLEPNSITTVYSSINIPKNTESLEYNGNIELYLNNSLISSNPLTINLSKVLLDPFAVNINVNRLEKLKNTYSVNLNIKNNYKLQKDLFIDFNLSEDWIIEGDKNIVIYPSQDLNLNYKIVTPYTLSEDYVSNINIKDRITGDMLKQEKIVFYPTISGMTGLFTFSNADGIIKFIILIIIILIIIYFIVRAIVKHNRRKLKNKKKDSKQMLINEVK